MALVAGVVIVGQSGVARALPITGVNLGVAEKGVILGVESNPGGTDQLELGVQVVEGQPAQIDAGLSAPIIPVEVFSGGVRLAYNRYLIVAGHSEIQSGIRPLSSVQLSP